MNVINIEVETKQKKIYVLNECAIMNEFILNNYIEKKKKREDIDYRIIDSCSVACQKNKFDESKKGIDTK